MSDEYDAFGRKKDDAGLGDLGWGASGNPGTAQNQPPAQTTVSASTTNTNVPPAPQFQTVRPLPSGMTVSGGGGRNPVIIFVQIAVIAAIGAAIYFGVSGGNSANNTAKKALDQFKSFTSPSKPNGTSKTSKEDSTVPKQVGARKLFTPAGLRASLKILQKEAPGRISNFSMRSDRIDIQVVHNGKTSVIDFPSDAEVPDVLNTSSSPSSTDTFSYEELNVNAPAKLMRAANARLNKSPADVDYFVAQKWTGAMQWGIYYKGGNPIAQGDSRGRYLRKIS